MDAPQIVTVTLNAAIDRMLAIDGFTVGAVNRVGEHYDRAGGKGVNVAAALADAGLPTAVAGFLGKENAAIFEALFAAKGIVDACLRVPGETRVGIKIADSVSGVTTDINFAGARVSAEALAGLRDELAPLVRAGRWFVLAGSLPPGLPPTAWAELVRWLREREARVLLDTSGEPLREAIAAGPDTIKPNLEELCELVGRELSEPAEVTAAARELIADGIGCVVVSMGPRGACFVTADEALLAVPPPVEVVSTVGAGDAMVAGILTALAEGLPLDQTARLATAFSMDRLTRLEAGLRPMQSIRQNAEAVSVERL